MSVDATSFDDEIELHSRATPGLGGVSFIPVPPTMAAPAGVSSVSSIAETPKRETAPQHRPVLPLPKNVMIDVINVCQMGSERLIAKESKIFDAEVAKCRTEMDLLEAEKHKILENEAKAVQSRDTWSTLSKIAQYVSSVGLIILGAACGGWPAAVLIAAGVVGVGNRLLHDTNLLQVAVSWFTKSEELQKKITRNIEMGAFFLQMGLGLAGGFAAWYAGAFAAAHGITAVTAVKKASSIISAASGVMGAGAKVGVEFHKNKIAKMEARSTEIKYQLNADSHVMSEKAAQMNKWLEMEQSVAEGNQKAIRSLEISEG